MIDPEEARIRWEILARPHSDDGWMDEDFVRASGEVICPECGREYWRHPQPAKELVPTLVRVCNGRLYKL